MKAAANHIRDLSVQQSLTGHACSRSGPLGSFDGAPLVRGAACQKPRCDARSREQSGNKESNFGLK